MKKVLGIVLAAVVIAGVSTTAFAAKAPAKKSERIVAEIISLDPASNTMVVKREENGESRTVKITSKAAAQLQVGDRVRIKYANGANGVTSVRVLGAPVVADTAVTTITADAAVEPAVPAGK